MSITAILRRIGPLNPLLLCVPAAAALEYGHVGGLWTFALAALAIIPLAAWMGHATEHLASRVGEGLGGFLNATFGNAAEMIIAIAALRKGQVEVVKSSIIGSIIGNLLLVFGLAMLLGGARRSRQKFDRTAAGAGVSMMVVSVVALVMPAIFHAAIVGFGGAGGGDAAGNAHPELPELERRLSLDISIVLLITYGLSLLFSLRTHRHLYVAEELVDGDEGKRDAEGAEAKKAEPAQGHGHHHAPGHGLWSVKKSLGVLLGATALIAWMSEILVHQLDAAGGALGLTPVFMGIFVVAIVGNAAEHSTAVLVALKNRMDLAMGVAVGACQQIALFVAPALVLLSYFFPKRLDFLYSPLEVIAVALSSFIFATVAADGESNWFEGVLFLAVYAIFGVGFYFLPG